MLSPSTASRADRELQGEEVGAFSFLGELYRKQTSSRSLLI